MASSGDLLADRRYGYAEAAMEEGDHAAAADLARQSLELAPAFAAGWFLLGRALSEGEDDAREEAVAAFARAAALDPADVLGARIRLATLGAADPATAMSSAYVRTLFDDYAIRFDRHLRQGLAYRAPELLLDAVRRTCSLRLRPFRFGEALDLGCGTGLAGELFRPVCRHLAGVDLSPGMLRRAAAKKLYDRLDEGDLVPALLTRPAGSLDLVLAADVFVYVADLRPVLNAAARALASGGLLAFTVQEDGPDGDQPALGRDGRFRHGPAYLDGAVAEAGLATLLTEPAITRKDRGADVPGRLRVLGR